MRENDIRDFALHLATAELTEVDTAIALIWYRQNVQGLHSSTAREIVGVMHDLSLRGKVNASRLDRNLAARPETIRSKDGMGYRLNLKFLSNLNTKYKKYFERLPSRIQEYILDPKDFNGTRPYIESLVLQINGCYYHQYYDACAVMCRRFVETLLIECFERKGLGAAIQQDKSYIAFGDMIGVAGSGNHVKLSRSAIRDLEQIKSAGDTAAHNRTYRTKRVDIEPAGSAA